MRLLTQLQSVLDFLGAGNVILGIVGLIATPAIDRLLVRRKRITYRVLYNSKLGVGPERLHDATEPHEANLRELGDVARLLDRMSIVVIRIRNTGSYDVHPSDFEPKLSFTFGRRVVWNARVSEASEDIREELKEGLEFFGGAGANRESLPAVRNRLRLFFSRPGGTPELEADPRWHGVRLQSLPLPRRQKFKLVVVLREPDDGGISKEVVCRGGLRDNGLIKDEKKQRLVTLPRVTGGLALLLTLLLVFGLVFAPSEPDQALARCASGTLRIEGSSVFMPTMTTLAKNYGKLCADAKITTTATGSIEGVRAVAADESGGLVALSDGKQDAASRPLHAEQLAIVVYHVVVNTSAGINAITTAQLQGIYAGKYTDWRQLRGGASLPIRIVGRGQNSGTRELFESDVLGTGESGLSSNECLTKDRNNPSAPVVRCERDSNVEVVRKISDTPGAIGYADAPAVTEARRSNTLVALTLDGRVFDAATGVAGGYPFWTVEYLYTKSTPASDSLAGRFLDYVRHDESAQLRLKDAGYLPCTTTDGAPVNLCNYR